MPSESPSLAELPPIPAKRYFTIGEVSELCGVKPHVLRYWEEEFGILKPMKTRGAHRQFRRRDVELALSDLLGHELLVLRRDSRFSNHPEYAFRHSLIQDAAYSMLSEKERKLAHGAAADWLDQQGEQDARVLAEHLRRSEEPERAVLYFVRAAISQRSPLRRTVSGAHVASVARLVYPGTRYSFAGQFQA
mgnify:CR=1 FL=1